MRHPGFKLMKRPRVRERNPVLTVDQNRYKHIEHMYSECVSLFLALHCGGCVWSDRFLLFKERGDLSDSSDCGLTQPLMSTEQRRSGPINKACLIQPQLSSLPSSLCLREDTTAVTQTGVNPLLLAVARGVIHMLMCQQI